MCTEQSTQMVTVWHYYRPLSKDLCDIFVYPPWFLDLGTHQNLLHGKVGSTSKDGTHLYVSLETTYLDILRLQSNYATCVDDKESIKGATLFTPMQEEI